ncbi:hypothetical protein [Persephonella sp. KM09-Lau-8]|uniref:hypothetical protein n=1 Tax=Persephonella sp. KM09-Lau-8 TaxID=1158345 RepID=UPI000495DB21|nr:hypothetical protein [Persephonella sp. KM09-Lau-8]
MKSTIENFLKKEKWLLKEKENIRKKLLSNNLKNLFESHGFKVNKITIEKFKFQNENVWNEKTENGILIEKIEIKGAIYDKEGEAEFNINYEYFHNSYSTGMENTDYNLNVYCDDLEYERLIEKEFPKIHNLIEKAYYINI